MRTSEAFACRASCSFSFLLSRSRWRKSACCSLFSCRITALACLTFSFSACKATASALLFTCTPIRMVCVEVLPEKRKTESSKCQHHYLTVWYAGCSAADKKALLKAINTAVNDSSQPGHNLFELQPSGRHSLKTWVSQILFLLPQLIYIYILFIYYTYPPCQKSSPADWKSADPGALCSNYLFLNNLIVCFSNFMD